MSVKEVPQIGDRIYTDFRECCEEQKVPYRWVCNKMLQEGVSVQDAVRYYKRKQEKKLQKAQKQVPVKGKMLEPQPVNVLGKKYESKERCYKGLGITKKSVQNHMKKTSCMFEEAVVYCYEKKLEKQFEFRREIYKSYNACYTAYNLAQEYVAIKAKREKITRQEAMEKLLAQRESEKTI